MMGPYRLTGLWIGRSRRHGWELASLTDLLITPRRGHSLSSWHHGSPEEATMTVAPGQRHKRASPNAALVYSFLL